MTEYIMEGLKDEVLIIIYITEGSKDKVLTIVECLGNLYQMTFRKVCRVDLANLVCLYMGGGLVKLWRRSFMYLNVWSTPNHGEWHEPM